MHKTTLVLDTHKLKQVRKALGTRSIRETVDRALDEVIALETRRKLLARLTKMKGIDLSKRTVVDAAWR